MFMLPMIKDEPIYILEWLVYSPKSSVASNVHKTCPKKSTAAESVSNSVSEADVTILCEK